MKIRTAARAATVTIAATFAFVGCGDSEEGGVAATATPAPETVTVQETKTVTQQAAAPEPEPSEPETKEPARSDDSGGQITVPDVVGKDHQAAQDRMQEAGLFALAEEDATGQGRMLLLDRNWTVVSQSPRAGIKVSEDQTITLKSKKDDE